MNKIREEAAALNLMYFKLVSGDEVVALINRNKPDESIVIVEEPLQMVRRYSQDDNSYAIEWQEWSPISENNIIAILRSNIVAYSKVVTNTKEHYLDTLIMLRTPDNSDDLLDELDKELDEVIEKQMLH